jgi:hypothetical protein
MTALDKRQQLIDLLKRAHQITQEVDVGTAGYQLIAALLELGVQLNEPTQQDAPIDETPYDSLTGEIFSTMHGLPIEEDGPETLEGIRLEAPYMEMNGVLSARRSKPLHSNRSRSCAPSSVAANCMR